MNKSINLLVPEKDNQQLRKRLETLRIISLVILLGIVTLSVTLFFLILLSPLPALRAQESAASQKLQGLRSTSGKLFLVRERLGKIDGIMKNRPAYDKTIALVTETIPTGADLDKLAIDKNMLSLTVSSSSLFTINAYIETLKKLKNEDKAFSTLVLSDLQYDSQDPRYVLIIQATL